jgi:hypothetical protein
MDGGDALTAVSADAAGGGVTEELSRYRLRAASNAEDVAASISNADDVPCCKTFS